MSDLCKESAEWDIPVKDCRCSNNISEPKMPCAAYRSRRVKIENFAVSKQVYWKLEITQYLLSGIFFNSDWKGLWRFFIFKFKWSFEWGAAIFSCNCELNSKNEIRW